MGASAGRRASPEPVHGFARLPGRKRRRRSRRARDGREPRLAARIDLPEAERADGIGREIVINSVYPKDWNNQLDI